MKKSQPQFRVGDQVRVRKGGTLYVITSFGPGTSCTIREHGTAPNGKPYASQDFDTSLLRHAITDEMLKAFSLPGLKAVRGREKI